MDKIAFLFPGQGSQAVGMARDLYQDYNEIRDLFDMTDDICKAHISRLCFKGPMEDLTRTIHLQPAVTAANLACLAAIGLETGPGPALVAGHSLGEYAALCAAGAITAEEAIRLVLERGRLMHRDSLARPGAMRAILGLDMDEVSALIRDACSEGPVSVANHNALKQIVITGSPEGVARAAELASEKGAKAIALKVSGAWHSELMAKAAEDFARTLEGFPFAAPKVPVVTNVTGAPESDAQNLHDLMARQLISPVRWVDACQAMHEAGTRIYVEVGPGKVLSGLLKRNTPKDAEIRTHNVDGLKGLETFLKAEA